ncbi:unnamed protein product [Linum trigynum]|uniref:Retrotransposon Copia-like N-terminal domain-containing protein n=1 Tax=Linum trigynum TaxID=586398 RepID=A0AAV2EV16_9ROSI
MFNPATSLPLKLTAQNFPSWCAQLSSLLDGLDLTDYLDGTFVVSDVMVTVNGASVCYPAYLRWYRQDQLLLNGIFASVSEGVLPFISSSATSYTAWSTLQRLYVGSSQSRVMTLSDRLYEESKGDRDDNAGRGSGRSSSPSSSFFIWFLGSFS